MHWQVVDGGGEPVAPTAENYRVKLNIYMGRNSLLVQSCRTLFHQNSTWMEKKEQKKPHAFYALYGSD